MLKDLGEEFSTIKIYRSTDKKWEKTFLTWFGGIVSSLHMLYLKYSKFLYVDIVQYQENYNNFNHSKIQLFISTAAFSTILALKPLCALCKAYWFPIHNIMQSSALVLNMWI